jgi:peptidoglycan/xylan/chitin deacetylase (PgdA/CDA1 family)
MAKKSVTFSFDDGVREDVPFVELLNKYGLKGTFNLNSGLADEKYRWVYKGSDVIHLNKSDLLDLYKGHEVAAHSLTHPFLEKLDEKKIYEQIYQDKCNLEDWYGEEVVGMAYPFGTYDDRVLEVLKRCGIKYARTIKTTPEFTPQSDLLQFKTSCCFTSPDLNSIIDRFLASESEQKQVLYIWGHTYQLGVDMSWADFEEVCKRLASVKGLVFETNKDALLKE